jgi:hypothetical protein
MMNPASLSRESSATLNSNQMFWIILVGMICLAIAWCVTFWTLRKKEEQLKALILEGNLLRLMTVIFIVFATSVLAIMDSLNESVSAIFGGIVGYVLGSMIKQRSTKSE